MKPILPTTSALHRLLNDAAALEAADEAMCDEVDRYLRLGRPVSGRKVLRAAVAAAQDGGIARRASVEDCT